MRKYAYVTTVVSTKRTYVVAEEDLQQLNLSAKPDLSWALDSIVCEEADQWIQKEETIGEQIVEEHWLTEAQLAGLMNDAGRNRYNSDK